jgi:hypothetical protein
LNGATKYGFIEKIYLCEGSFYFLVKKLRKSTNNHLLNNSKGKIMKNVENDINFLEYCNRFYLLLRETDEYEVIKIRNITSKCVLNEKKSLLMISPCTNTECHD